MCQLSDHLSDTLQKDAWIVYQAKANNLGSKFTLVGLHPMVSFRDLGGEDTE